MRRVALCAVLTACSFEHGAVEGVHDAAGSSDGKLDGDVVGGWSTPVDIGLSTPDGDDDPSLTDDLLEIYWGSRRPLGGLGAEDIWTASRSSPTDQWSTPVDVAVLNSINTETTMKVTGDGLSIFFSSTRGGGGADIYFSSRPNRSALWATPVKVNELSTSGGDYAAFAQSNLRHLVLCSGANTAAEAIYVSERANTANPWAVPSKITELDETGISECDPMEPHPRAMYYSSQRLTGDSTYDIWRVYRATVTDPYGSRTKVEGVNTDGHNDRDPWVSADERTMVFSSDRDGVNDKLYMSTR